MLEEETATELETEDCTDISTACDQSIIPLAEFIEEFGDDLMESVVRNNPPVYDGNPNESRQLVMEGLLRQPFEAQAEAVQALSALLFDGGEKAAILNAEMGTGKTMMGISVAAIATVENYKHTVIISPPHLVYKWRREIQETIANAKVWVLNGPDTLAKLLKLRELLNITSSEVPEFFIIGRVRMRLGYHWRHAFSLRKFKRLVAADSTGEGSDHFVKSTSHPVCSDCGAWIHNDEGELLAVNDILSMTKQTSCAHCNAPLWTLIRAKAIQNHHEVVKKSLCQLPTIGPKTADKLIDTFGAKMLEGMLSDNIYEFTNLMDGKGEFVFNDRKAARIERALATIEFGFGQGGYQPTEFFKRYLPRDFIDLIIVDEGHEYKNQGSAQGQAMGVLCGMAKKVLLLTGTLMGGYATDLFYLLWRIMPNRMIELGYRYSDRGSLSSASMAFMRDHGVLKDIFKETNDGNHKTSRGKRVTQRTAKGAGFGPLGISQCVLPFTVFLKLSDIGQKVLPPYNEDYIEIDMTDDQRTRYDKMESLLMNEMKQALAKGDTSLLGVVLNACLAWPDTCFRDELIKHPKGGRVLASIPALFDQETPTPKEEWLINYCVEEKRKNRRTLVYSVYTGKRDTLSRLKSLLSDQGLKVAVMRATVSTDKREEWIADQIDKGIDVLICNPELVKTGLDLLEFPSIVFMQTGYNVYTLMQASRRSWRIGQTEDVNVTFLGYSSSAQSRCLALMAEKISVSQSTSGDIPESGLDSLNSTGDSIEMSLARQLAA